MNIKRFSLSSRAAVLCLGLVGSFVLGRPVRAAESLLGAEAAMKRIAEATAQTPVAAKAVTPADTLRKDLDAFRVEAERLAPAEAARQWLALADRIMAQPPGTGVSANRRLQRLGADEWFGAMPPPSAWAEISKAVQARPAANGPAELREIGLRLLAATLNDDIEGRNRGIAAVQGKAEKANQRQVYMYRNFLNQVNQALIQQLDDPDAVLKSLERQLAGFQDRNSFNRLNVPNLVPLVGPEKAEIFLRKALVHPNAEFELPENTVTSALAEKLALELIDQLKRPHWSLVNSLSSVDLYEALEKKFVSKAKAARKTTPAIPGLPDLDLPDPSSPDDYQRHSAQAYYLLGLIAKQRTKDAVAVAVDLGKEDNVYLPHDAMKAMELAGYTHALDVFLNELLTQHPELPFWDEYVSIAAKAGETDRMLALVRTTSQRTNLTKTQKANVQQWLPRALLAADQVDEGVKELRALIELKSQQVARSGRGGIGESDAALSLQLARIGQQLARPEWIEEGIKATRLALKQSTNSEMTFQIESHEAIPLAHLLMELNRPGEAESVLVDALIQTGKVMPGVRRNYMGPGAGQSGLPLLSALAALYQAAGRPQDVLILLDQNPGWGIKDIAKSRDSRFSYSNHGHIDGSETPPILLTAASALSATGREAEARKLINALLDQNPGLDSAYELLLKLAGNNIPARLDELFARDRFEERPLIWKAHWLRLNNRLPEAETVARQAVAIDPADGEQGPGDRLRAYAVLADIREARGDATEARFLRGAVGAIRLSETADQVLRSGLLKRALQMYRDSLKQFADAYCIQSRLAIQLSEMGLHAEAEEHYRRAYELMPESFGRVESHCFGCERAFDGERAQGVAEKVFTQLAVKTPNKPQVHYLLGYLRAEQGRYAEAVKLFQKAVELDPEYLNAWKKIEENSRHAFLPMKERNRVTLNIFRLDPLGRHSGADLAGVNDLRTLWDIAKSAAAQEPPKIDSLYPLAASKAALEQQEADRAKQTGNDFGLDMIDGGENRAVRSPGRMIAETSFVKLSGELIVPAYGGGDDE